MGLCFDLLTCPNPDKGDAHLGVVGRKQYTADKELWGVRMILDDYHDGKELRRFLASRKCGYPPMWWFKKLAEEEESREGRVGVLNEIETRRQKVEGMCESHRVMDKMARRWDASKVFAMSWALNEGSIQCRIASERLTEKEILTQFWDLTERGTPVTYSRGDWKRKLLLLRSRELGVLMPGKLSEMLDLHSQLYSDYGDVNSLSKSHDYIMGTVSDGHSRSSAVQKMYREGRVDELETLITANVHKIREIHRTFKDLLW